MLALYELPGGYALFKAVEGGGFKLLAQKMFADSNEAVEACQSLQDSKLHSSLKKFLKKNVVDKSLQESLAVQDAKLAGLIKTKLDIQCVFDTQVEDLMRTIREQILELIEGVTAKSMHQMSLGLAHSLSRHKMKFSADKIDVMVIQAIGLLDDLDKELNTYVMRVKEWYGWHFPELTKVVSDNVTYARLVLLMGPRENAPNVDLTEVLTEEDAAHVKDAAIHSMGVGLTEDDLVNIRALCEEIIATSQYRAQLAEYLRNRMVAIAPNLTTMVGELVGARLISHAGSLMNLAKSAASTIQILGAEKALFSALKEKTATPKYGLIYHASCVGAADGPFKGKIARLTACQAALATRVDALAEGVVGPTIGVDGRERVEVRLRKLQAGEAYTVSGRGRGQAQAEKYNKHAELASRGPAAPTQGTIAIDQPTEAEAAAVDDSAKAKKKKRKLVEAEGEALPEALAEPAEEDAEVPKKKKKKSKVAEE